MIAFWAILASKKGTNNFCCLLSFVLEIAIFAQASFKNRPPLSSPYFCNLNVFVVRIEISPARELHFLKLQFSEKLTFFLLRFVRICFLPVRETDFSGLSKWRKTLMCFLSFLDDEFGHVSGLEGFGTGVCDLHALRPEASADVAPRGWLRCEVNVQL